MLKETWRGSNIILCKRNGRFSQENPLISSLISVTFSLPAKNPRREDSPGTKAWLGLFFYFFLPPSLPSRTGLYLLPRHSCPCRFIFLPKRNAKLAGVWPRSTLVLLRLALEMWPWLSFEAAGCIRVNERNTKVPLGLCRDTSFAQKLGRFCEDNLS